MKPIGASSTDDSARQSRSSLIARNAATAHAIAIATPFGRVAVVSAANTPASNHRRSYRHSIAAAASTSISASLYANESTKLPGNNATSVVVVRPDPLAVDPLAEQADQHHREEAEHGVEHQHGHRVAAREHGVGGLAEHREQREERRPGLVRW